jgi:hypothetical protein
MGGIKQKPALLIYEDSHDGIHIDQRFDFLESKPGVGSITFRAMEINRDLASKPGWSRFNSVTHGGI